MSKKEEPKKDKGSNKNEITIFPIVGIGASAGGLAAIKSLLQTLPPKHRIRIRNRLTPRRKSRKHASRNTFEIHKNARRESADWNAG